MGVESPTTMSRMENSVMDTCLTMEFPTTTNLLSDKRKMAELFARAIQGSLGDSFIPRIFRNSTFTLAEHFESQSAPKGAAPEMKLDYQVGNEKFSLTVYLEEKRIEIAVSKGDMLPNYGKINKLQDKIRELTNAGKIQFYEGRMRGGTKPIADLREWIKVQKKNRPS